MLEIIISAVAIWLFIKSIGLLFKLTWGITKIIATILVVIAVPAFVLCLIFAGGFILLLPLALLVGAVVLLVKACT